MLWCSQKRLVIPTFLSLLSHKGAQGCCLLPETWLVEVTFGSLECPLESPGGEVPSDVEAWMMLRSEVQFPSLDPLKGSAADAACLLLLKPDRLFC